MATPENVLRPDPAGQLAVATPENVLTIEDLHVEFNTRRGAAQAVDGVDLSIARGEVLGIVGESGCGKSVTALSVMRLIDQPGRISSGHIELSGKDILALSQAEMRAVRGKQISMIFQDPSSTLNPVIKIGDQITELLRHHTSMGRGAARARAAELLASVGIPSPKERLDRYPHEFSGGMQQRVVIAIAVALGPALLLADEPTTALDVTIQAEILDLIQRLQAETGTATMMISHDIGVIAQTCDRVAVMYAGKVVETGSVADVIGSPAHPYTVALIDAVPRIENDGSTVLRPIAGGIPDIVNLPTGCRFHPRCPHAMDICHREQPPLATWREGHAVACHLYTATTGNGAATTAPVVRDLTPPAAAAPTSNGHSTADAVAPLLRVEGLVKDFPGGWKWHDGHLSRRALRAVDNVNLEIAPGEALGLVGESGCGKSTTGRIVMRLSEPTAGRVFLEDVDLTGLSRAQLFQRRSLFQMVFQNPHASLDPRWTVERIIAEPLDVHEALSRSAKNERVIGLLSSVSLGQLHLSRFPHQLSGGQRQRVAIARALALDARLLVADEPVSSLDVSIQAQILELLAKLKQERGLSLLFISHNLAVVQYLCERVAVMYAGRIMETGLSRTVLQAPRHPYTQMLVSAIPEPRVQAARKRIVSQGEIPSLTERKSHCPFHTRCVHAREICRTETPPEVSVGNGQSVACHLVASGEL